jgi:hypothetical protein
MDIYNYSSTAKYKTVRGQFGLEQGSNNNQNSDLVSGYYANFSPISSFYIFDGQSNGISANSSFALYGMA